MWISWFVLSAAAVITQSLPRPDKAYKIPEVPTEKRAQYYVLHSDGNYKYGYDTGAGQFEKAVKMAGEVTGAFGFNNADGDNVRIDYTAGVDGFQPETVITPGVAVPAPAPAPVEYAAPAPVPVVAVEPRGDASYSFGYVTDDSDREESADADLNVKGRFSFVAPDGVRRRVNYIAGSATGFVAEGDHLPKPVDALVAGTRSAAVDYVPFVSQYSAPPEALEFAEITNVLNADGSYKFSYDAGDKYREESADNELNVVGKYGFIAPGGKWQRINYIAGSETGYVAQGDIGASVGPAVKSAPAPAPVAVPAPASAAVVAQDITVYTAPAPAPMEAAVVSTPVARPDASYKFGYKTDVSDREESADADLNVNGRFSFVADDGLRRTVNYKAGSATGFIADGDHLPVTHDLSSDSIVAVASTASEAAAPPPAATLKAAAVVSASEQAVIDAKIEKDASYTFSYKTSDSERSESSDSDLNVDGHYSFIADDGVSRKVTYKAGSATGFVAEGDHLPVAPAVEVSAAVAPVEVIVKSAAAAEAAPAPAPVPETPAVKSAVEVSADDSSSDIDGSYKFSYKTADSERSESADKHLNVRGHYSFTADDGVSRTVLYKAGSETGFVAKGDHLPVAPEAAAVAVEAAPAVVVKAAPVVAVQAAPAIVVEAAPAVAVVKSASEDAKIESSSGSDASYSFSYKTADSERSETADANLNVNGHFSFTADDGLSRTVTYKAGSETGFVAKGDHLPVAPEVAVVSEPAPAAVVLKSATVVAEPAAAAVVVKSATVEEANIDSTAGIDGSYSFGYKTGDSERSETADSDLNVKGHYSFTADDGVSRSVSYKAGSATGFIAEGSHLPVAPEAVVAPVQPAAPIPVLVKSAAAVVEKPAIEVAAVRSSSDLDGSYSFNYKTADSERTETADSDLNVRGHFSFVADDGLSRTVIYRAGSDTGFVAKGDHLPASLDVVVPATVVEAAPSPVVPILKTADLSEATANEIDADSSYSFSYANSNSARDESADKNLNVEGNFKFVGDDGVERIVNYIAGSATGFVAKGSHIPQVVPVAAVPVAVPSVSLRTSADESKSVAVESLDSANLSTRGAIDSVAFRAANYVEPAVAVKVADSPTSYYEGEVGNVLLRKYIGEPSRTKFGYVYTEV